MENRCIIFHPVYSNGKPAFDIDLSGSEIVAFSKAYLCPNFIACYEGTKEVCGNVKIYGGKTSTDFDEPDWHNHEKNDLSSMYGQFMKKAEE